VEQELLSRRENQSSPKVFSGFCVAQPLDIRAMFYISLFVLLAIALSFALWLLITPFVSSNVLVFDWNGQIQHIIMSLTVEIFKAALSYNKQLIYEK
jgi:hypothetical protein